MSLKSKWITFEPINYIDIENKEIKNLPNGISISTMCATCKLNTQINVDNIKKYLQLNQDDIITVKIDKEEMRTLVTTKTKPKRVKKIDTKNNKDISKNHFYNQITVVVRIDHGNVSELDKVPKINIKLFKNGSIQMSGCKSLKSINLALNKLIIKLKEDKFKIENDKIVKVPFIDDPINITVKDFKIDMINSNYKVNMHIDRDKLYSLLLKKKIKSSYEPCIRACVIIKYVPEIENIDLKEVSIFVFQKGNIIITGARSKNHIISAYNYINEILILHSNDITKQDDEDSEEKILHIYNDIIREINCGIIKL